MFLHKLFSGACKEVYMFVQISQETRFIALPYKDTESIRNARIQCMITKSFLPSVEA